MSLTITIPGADFSGSGLPQLDRLIAGFSSINLRGLYLFEDGATGASISSALDSSGLGNHAPLATGGGAGVKAMEGLVSTSATNPAVFSAPGLALGQAFSAVMVGKSDMPANIAGAYSWWWRPSSDIGSGVDASQFSGEDFNLDRSANSFLQVGWYNAGGYMDGVTSTLTRRTISKTTSVNTAWWTAAISFNPAANRYRTVALGTNFETVSAIPGALSAAKVGTHLFGVGRYNAVTMPQPGQVGLFALYAGEKSVADLAALVTAAQTRMALRGVTSA